MRSALSVIPIFPELMSIITAHLDQQWDRELTEQLMTREQYARHWKQACTQFIGLSLVELDRRYGWMKCVDYGWLFRFLSAVESRVYRVQAPVPEGTLQIIEANVHRTLEWHSELFSKYFTSSSYTCCEYYNGPVASVFYSSPNTGTVMFCDASRPHKYDCREQKRIIAVLAHMYACRGNTEDFREMVGLATTYLLCHDNVSTISGLWAFDPEQHCCCHSILEQVLTSTADPISFQGLFRDILGEQVHICVSAMMNAMEEDN